MRAEMEVRLLGGFRVTVAGQAIPDRAWRRVSARSLVKVLALSEGHRLHRERLCDVLWPDLAPDAAAANLRKALHFTRQALRPDLVVSDHNTLALPPDRTWVDVDALESAVADHNTAAAYDLYAGDLLPEDQFAEWAAQPRERLRGCYAELMQERAAEQAAAGDHRGAAEILERLARADPLNEQVVAALMSAHAAAGRRHLALGWYRELEQRLADELGVRPNAALRTLRARIVEARPTPATKAASTAADDVRRPTDDAPAERKLVTVVLVEPSEHAAAADVEVMQSDRAEWLRLAYGVLEAWGGTARPLVGSGVIAVFGLPAVHEDDSARALRAGLQLVELLGPRVRVCAAAGEILASAGAHTDPRDIAGEALDVALALQDESRPGAVVASDRTCRAAGPAFGRVPIHAGFEVVRELDPSVVPPHRLGPMVGRTSELAIIDAVLEAVTHSRSPRLLIVVGAPGVGKTRLVAEAIAAAQAKNPAITVLSGRCVAAGQDVTYLALGDIIRQACDITIGDRPERTAARLQSGLRRILASLPEADLEPAIDALAVVAGVPLPNGRSDEVPPKQIQEELARAWTLFASGCGAERPAILVVEDLHWASPALLDILEMIVARATGPVLVVATARPELATVRPGFGGARDGLTAISLQPLYEAESRTLLADLLAPEAVPTARREEVLYRAEGNPLFLEQLALHIEEHGEPSLPDSLHGLLTARIDAVSPPARRVLQWAAVVGRSFWVNAIQLALPDQPVAEVLDALERRGLITARMSSSLPHQVEYAFRHALVRDAAYASMPKADRARAHAHVGTWLAQLGLGDENVTESLAHHFGEAVAGEGADLAWTDPTAAKSLRATAFTHLLAAGTIARRRFDIDKAIEVHRRCQSLAADDDESITAAEALGEDHEAAFRGDDARQCYLEALALARDPADEARLCCKLAVLMAGIPGAFHVSPEPESVETLITRGLSLTKDDVEAARLLVARGMSARLWRGSEPFGQGLRPDPIPVHNRIVDVERAARIARRVNRPDLGAQADDALRVLYGIAGQYPAVLSSARRRLGELGRIRSRLEQADILRGAAVAVMWIAGDFEQGLQLSTRAHELSMDTNPHQLMHATWPRLVALYQLGRWFELQDILDEHVVALDAEPAFGCHFVRDGPLIGATMYAHRGEYDRAADLAARVGDPSGDPETATAWQARYAVASGSAATALMISRDKAAQAGIYAGQHAHALVEALVALSNWTDLSAALPTARAATAGNALLPAHCDRAEGLAALAAGQPARAGKLLYAALTDFKHLHVPFEQARCLEYLADIAEPAERDRLQADAQQIRLRLGIATPQPRSTDGRGA